MATITANKKEKVVEATTETASKETGILYNYDENVVSGIRACIKLNESILLVGETGTGKTTLIHELAKQEGKKLHRVSVNGSMSVDEILGKWLAKDGSTYWIDGILTKAVREGHWVIFDEINAMLPEMGFALHSLLDDARTITLAEKDGELIPAHPEFRFFGSMNPSDEYAGTKEVNMALMSRFGGVFQMSIFNPEQEVAVLERHGIKKTTATKLVNLAANLRTIRANGDMSTFVSTRDIIQAGKLVEAGLEIEKAVLYAVFNKFTKEERDDLAKQSSMKIYTAELPKTTKEKELEVILASKEGELESYKKAYREASEALKAKGDEMSKMKDPFGGELDPKKLELLRTLGVIKRA